MIISYSADFLILVLWIIWLTLEQNFLFKEYPSVSVYTYVTDVYLINQTHWVTSKEV